MIRILTKTSKGRVYTFQNPLNPGFWVTLYKFEGKNSEAIQAINFADATLNHLELIGNLK